MLALFTVSAGLIANGVQPMAPAARLAAPTMKTSGVKVVVPDKCVACPHLQLPTFLPRQIIHAATALDVEPWRSGWLSAAYLKPVFPNPPSSVIS